MKKHSFSASLPRSIFCTAAASLMVGAFGNAASVAAAEGRTFAAAGNSAPAAAFQEGTESTTYGGIEFDHLSFDNAISRAERTKKILVILWVDADRVKETALAQRVFGDEGTQRWMADNATAVRIDASVRKKDAQKAGANKLPAIDILDVVRGLSLIHI